MVKTHLEGVLAPPLVPEGDDVKVPIETDDELRNEPQRGEQASGSEMSADASAQTEEKELVVLQNKLQMLLKSLMKRLWLQRQFVVEKRRLKQTSKHRRTRLSRTRRVSSEA